MRNKFIDNLRTKYILTLLMWTIYAVGATAQTQLPGINKALIPIYTRGENNLKNASCLLTADTLMQQAMLIGDKKAQCLALTIKTRHYSTTRNLEEMDKAVTELKKKARETGLLQYYYYAWNNFITAYLNNDRYIKAMEMSKQMFAEAKKDKHPYGIYISLLTAGNIYHVRQEYNVAAQKYQEAYDFVSTHKEHFNNVSIASRLAREYIQIQKYDEAEQVLREWERTGLDRSKTQEMYTIKCIIDFEKGNYSQFKKDFATMQKYAGGKNTDLKSSSLVMFYNALSDKDYAKAQAMTDNLKTNDSSLIYRRHEILYEHAGDYRKAYEYSRKRAQLGYNEKTRIASADIAEMSTLINMLKIEDEAKRLQLENQQLQLNNTALALNNANLEIEKMNSIHERDKMQHQNVELKLRNKDLELRRNNAIQEQKRAELEKNNQRIRTTNRVVMAAMLLCLTFGIWMWWNNRQKKRMNRIITRQNKTLTEANERVKAADNMKTAFLQNISHEIRTPMNAIVGFAQVLTMPGMEISDEEKEDLRERILHNSDLLTTLINDLLDFSMIERGKLQINRKLIKVNTLLHNALASVSHRCPNGVKMHFTSSLADEETIFTDEKRLLQVLINFLTNSCKNTTNGEIHLHCEKSGRQKLKFSVTDTGIGIPKDKIDTIFQRFEKLDSFKQGTGLGLNICQMIAHHLDGSIWIDKEYTAGARFVFELPQNG